MRRARTTRAGARYTLPYCSLVRQCVPLIYFAESQEPPQMINVRSLIFFLFSGQIYHHCCLDRRPIPQAMVIVLYMVQF